MKRAARTLVRPLPMTLLPRRLPDWRVKAQGLEAARAAGEMLHVKVVGLVRIASDVTPELALQTIGSLTVLGALQANPQIKAALAARIK